MPLRACCPFCDKSYTVGDALAGKSVRCKECGEVFQVAPAKPAKQAAPTRRTKPASGEAVRSGAPKAVRRSVDEDQTDDEDVDQPRKKKRSKKKADRTPLIVGAAVAGGVVAVIAITFLIVAARPSGPAPAPIAAPVPVAAEKPVAPKENGIPFRPSTVANGQRRAELVADKPAADDEAPADFYGKLEGEPAGLDHPAKSVAERRPRADDTIVRLSNFRIDLAPRVGVGVPTGAKGMMIDFEVVHRGKYDGASLTIVDGKGSRSERKDSARVYEDRGTLVFVLGLSQTITDAEVYLTRTDSRFDPPITVKVSNSVILGNIEIGTRVRNWTNSEYDAYRKGPPNYRNPNAFPKIGKDTAWAGNRSRADGFTERFVEPNGHLLGFEIQMGEVQSEKVIRFLKPILTRSQPILRDKAQLAKEGYAVSGLEVRADKGQLNAVKIHFGKLKADGSLDSAGAYASAWIGPPPESGKGILLGDTGVPVIGANLDRTVTSINAVALVMAK